MSVTMQAIRYHRQGPADVLQLERVAMPEPQAGEIRGRVEAIGVNFADVMRRAGDHYPIDTPLPFCPGGEAVGTIEAIGPGVSDALLGQRVILFPGSGCYAEAVVAPLSRIYPIPDAIDGSRAIALFVQGLTAAIVLRECARLATGETVLIQGAAGGVGTLALQLARIYGAGTVIGLAGSDAKRELVLSLGADTAIDYRKEGWEAKVRAATGGRGVDIVLDMVGGEIGRSCLDLLAPFGRLVTYGASSGMPLMIDGSALPPRALTVTGFWLRHYLDRDEGGFVRARLEELVQLVLRGELAVEVGLELPLSDAAEAHRAIELRHTSGKVVLLPGPAGRL